jgi:hypothetical protein
MHRCMHAHKAYRCMYAAKRLYLSALQDMADHDGAEPADILCSRRASSSSSRPKQDDGGIGTSSLGTMLVMPPIRYSSSSSKEGSVSFWFAISAFHCSKASCASVFLPRTSKVSSRWFSSPVDCSCTFLRDCWTAPTVFGACVCVYIFIGGHHHDKSCHLPSFSGRVCLLCDECTHDVRSSLSGVMHRATIPWDA